VRLEKGQLDAAAAVLAEALTLRPGDGRSIIGLVEVYKRQSQPAKAIELLDKELASTPDNIQLLNLLGNIHFEAGETKKAPESKAAPTKAAAPAMKYKEAPVLAALVKAGKLPAVEKRLPDNPLVVPADEIGQYGGVWRRGFLGPSDFNGVNRIVYDVLARFGPDGATIETKLAESVTPSADFRTWTVKLRKGMKWSDGSPFTTDDIMYWYKDVLQNKDLVPAIPSWMKNKDGSTVLVEKVDGLTVKWTYNEPNTNFLLELTTKDYGDKMYPIFQPSKYLKQFHAGYAKKEDLDKKVADVMTKDRLVTVSEGIGLEESKKLLHEHRIEKLLVVDKNGRLTGLITIKDIEKIKRYPNACKDGFGRLRVGAAVGVGSDM